MLKQHFKECRQIHKNLILHLSSISHFTEIAQCNENFLLFLMWRTWANEFNTILQKMPHLINGGNNLKCIVTVPKLTTVCITTRKY